MTCVSSVAAVAAVPAVTAMHEPVEQRAGGQQEIGQHAEDVRLVLADEEETGDRQESQQHPPARQAPHRAAVPTRLATKL